MSAALDEMIATLRKLGANNVELRVAAAAAKRLEASLRASLAAGQSPEGQAWAPRKSDDGRAFAGAAGKLLVTVAGQYIRTKIVAPEVYGHYGAKGAPKRQMIPDAGAAIPKSVSDALDAGAADALKEITR